MKVVEYYKEYPGEEPFMMGDQKFEYCWGKYPNGKVDIAVYSFGNDMAYDYNDFRSLYHISEAYQQPKMFMDIKETQIASVGAPTDLNEFENDPTIGELIGQTRQSVGAETSALMAGDDDNVDAQITAHNQEELGRQQMGAPVNMYEEAQAPEAKEFMGTEKLQASKGDNGLAGSTETGDGPKIADSKEISSMLDRMKELTKILTNTPDVQWDGQVGISSPGSLVDEPKEVDPVDVVRAETETGAPSIEILKQELRPENPIITKSAPKADSSSPAPKAEKSESGEKKESGKPWEKKEESKPAEKKEDSKPEEKKEEKKDDDETVDEAMSHHMGMKRRNIAHNENDPNRIEENEEEPLNESVLAFSDDEILEGEDTELMYEAMVRYKMEPDKCIKFKRRIDEITSERRLNEAIAKMRRRF